MQRGGGGVIRAVTQVLKKGGPIYEGPLNGGLLGGDIW